MFTQINDPRKNQVMITVIDEEATTDDGSPCDYYDALSSRDILHIVIGVGLPSWNNVKCSVSIASLSVT